MLHSATDKGIGKIAIASLLVALGALVVQLVKNIGQALWTTSTLAGILGLSNDDAFFLVVFYFEHPCYYAH